MQNQMQNPASGTIGTSLFEFNSPAIERAEDVVTGATYVPDRNCKASPDHAFRIGPSSLRVPRRTHPRRSGETL
jgi:hypothetical protein